MCWEYIDATLIETYRGLNSLPSPYQFGHQAWFFSPIECFQSVPLKIFEQYIYLKWLNVFCLSLFFVVVFVCCLFLCLRALDVLQEINQSKTRRNSFSELAMNSLLNSNLSFKYSLTGYLASTDIITCGFYDAGKVCCQKSFLEGCFFIVLLSLITWIFTDNI